MPLNDFQFTYDGFTFGDGTDFGVNEIEGLASSPDVRTSDRERAQRHGLLPGTDLLAGRTVTLRIEVFGADAAAFNANMDALKAAFRLGRATESPLAFQVPGVAGGGTRFINARPRRLHVTVDVERYLHQLPFVLVEFDATDPLIYAETLTSLTAQLTTAGGGLTFPVTAPIVFGSVADSGTIIATNDGAFPVPPFFRIDGPCTGPRIESITADRTLEFNITLGADDFLEVDANSRTVLLNGTASRYSTLVTPEWFDLEPGANELKFRAVTGTAASLTVEYRNAWL